MELEYSLSSFRSQQGLPVEFEDTKPEVMGIVSSTSAYDKYYVIRNTAVLEGDTSPDIGVSRVQTSDKVSVSQGMNHVEGGWPQEVDTESSAELKERIRGRILRADEILPAVIPIVLVSSLPSALLRQTAGSSLCSSMHGIPPKGTRRQGKNMATLGTLQLIRPNKSRSCKTDQQE